MCVCVCKEMIFHMFCCSENILQKQYKKREREKSFEFEKHFSLCGCVFYGVDKYIICVYTVIMGMCGMYINLMQSQCD